MVCVCVCVCTGEVARVLYKLVGTFDRDRAHDDDGDGDDDGDDGGVLSALDMGTSCECTVLTYMCVCTCVYTGS